MRTRFSPIAIGFLALTTASALRAQCGEASLGSSLTNATYQDDAVMAIQPLGFPFPFNGTTYSDVHISTNGLLYLSNAGTPAPGGPGCCAGSTATLIAGAPIIAPMWNDLVTDPAYGGELMFNALPGRAVITWLNSREYQDTNAKTFQVQLLATGEIWMTYDSRCNVHVAGDMLVGMSEGVGATLPAASDFAAVGTSITTTNFELFNAVGSFDLAGQAVQFLPTSPGYAWVPQVCPLGANLVYGRGCYEQANSFYQLTVAPAASSAALSNTAITLVPTGTGYVVTNGGAFVAPTGAATPITLTDDSSAASPALTTPFPYPGGTAASFQVCSNGSVWVAAGNSTAYAPDVNTMLNTNLQTAWYAWHDYNPTLAGSGQVKFEQVANIAYVTWDGVYNYGGTTAADATQMQFQFDTATGTVVIAFGTVSSNVHTGFALGQPHLVGYSPGGASTDFGSLVFASDLPYTTTPTESPAMSLSAAPTPALGTTMTYTVVDLPEYAPTSGIYLTTLFLSVVPLPGGFDLGIIGAPDCNAYIATLDVDMGGQLSFTPTASWNLNIAPGVFAVGNVVAAQAVALVVPNSLPNGQNAFGMTVSNGLQSTVGAW